jgi:flagellar protein FliS
VTELLCMLNIEQGEDIASNLQRLYVYAIGRLTEANFTHEVSLIDNVIVILQNLRSAWAEVDFKKAMADAPPGNGRNGTASGSATPHQTDQNSRILSVTI